MVFSSFLGFCFAGIGLFISVALEISLRFAKIHPEDYDSAEIWASYFSVPLNLLAAFEFFAYFCLAAATNWNTFIRFTKAENNFYQTIFAIGVLAHFVVIPLLVYGQYYSMKKMDKRRQFRRIENPSSVLHALQLIDPSFAEKYGQTFSSANIGTTQLTRLTTDHMLGLKIPLGDAIRLLDGFRTIKIDNDDDDDADDNDLIKLKKIQVARLEESATKL